MADKPEYSVEVEERIDLSNRVITAVETHAEQGAKNLDNSFKLVPNNPENDWNHVLLALAGCLRYHTDILSNADLAHSLEISQDVKAREERNKALKVAYDGAVSTRRILQGLFGDEFLVLLGFKGATPTKATRLLRTLQDVRQKVDNMAPWPQSPPDAPAWSQDSLINWLDGIANPLESAINAVLKDVQESKATMAAKWAAMEEHNRVYVAVSQAVIALFRLAKEDVLAARIRPNLPKIPPMPVVAEADADAEADGEAKEDGPGLVKP